MEYKFYVKMDGQEFGPYSLAEIKELPLLPDTLVTESRLNGEWVTAETFDFEDLSCAVEEQESSARSSAIEPPASPTQASTNPRPDHSIHHSEPRVYTPAEPAILSKWNWGAFALSWIWSVCNGIYWPLVIIACNFIPYAGPFIAFGICVYLGICGNKLAWRVAKEKSQTDREFLSRQSKWDTAGIIIFIISIVSSVIGVFLANKYGFNFSTF